MEPEVPGISFVKRHGFRRLKHLIYKSLSLSSQLVVCGRASAACSEFRLTNILSAIPSIDSQERPRVSILSDGKTRLLTIFELLNSNFSLSSAVVRSVRRGRRSYFGHNGSAGCRDLHHPYLSEIIFIKQHRSVQLFLLTILFLS